jgi:hypothetical protein
MTIFRCKATFALVCGLVAGGGAAMAQAPGAAIRLPSEVEVTLLDVITNVPGQGLTYRFRFLASHILGDVDYETVAGDMQFLCDSYALPRLSKIGPKPRQIVITLMDRPVPFGEISPEVVQFFEAYRPGADRCEWENF